MLLKEIQSVLNSQVGMEAQASFSYLAMASWCEKTGLMGCAKFFYRQSDEERTHMLKFFKYINEAGGHSLTPQIKKVLIDYGSILEVFESALRHEIENTQSINAIVKQAFESGDYGTFNFLQWFVAEQHEEEMLFRSILDKIRIIGNEEKGLFWIDKEVGSLEVK